MADCEPPLADLHPLRALFLIPSNKPPMMQHPRKWTKHFRDFLKQALLKDFEKRPLAEELLKVCRRSSFPRSPPASQWGQRERGRPSMTSCVRLGAPTRAMCGFDGRSTPS